VAESLSWAQEILDMAKATGDADLLIAGHNTANNCYFWLGDLNEALKHGDKVLALYDDEQHRHLADLFNMDPKTMNGAWRSQATWMLGYPDQAVRLSDEKDAHARQRGHPFDLGWALSVGADVFDFRCEPETLR
jgi:hypothetical protein